MKKTTLLLTLAFALSNCTPTQAQFQIPYGFSEREGARIYIDFDGDGEKDIATIIAENDPEFTHIQYFAFLLYLTGDNQTHIVEFGEGVAFPLELEIIENDVIQFGYVLGGTGVIAFEYRIRYNHEKRRIQVIGFDYNWRGGEESYDLLTGDFHVTESHIVITPNDSLKIREITRRGNQPMQIAFIEDINNGLIERLLAIRENRDYGYYLITEQGTDMFTIGKQIPFEAFRSRGYMAQEDDEFCETIERYVPFFRIFENEENKVAYISLNHADFFAGRSERYHRSPIRSVKIFSRRYKTAEGIGVGSSVADLFDAYGDRLYDSGTHSVSVAQTGFRFYFEDNPNAITDDDRKITGIRIDAPHLPRP